MVELAAPGGGKAKGLASIRQLGIVDGLEVTFLGLSPKATYALYVAANDRAPFKDLRHLTDVSTNPRGGGQAQAVGPLRELLRPTSTAAVPNRFLIVFPAGETKTPVLLGKVAGEQASR